MYYYPYITHTMFLLQPDQNQIAVTNQAGIYLFLLKIDFVGNEKPPKDYKLNVTITMKGSYGYLSAQDWPLLPVCEAAS